MEKLAMIPLAVTLLVLSTSLHLQAQGAKEAAAAAADHAGTAEYVLLEPEAERVVAVPAMSPTAVNAPNLVCGSCKCCLKAKDGTNPGPGVCLTTCCFDKTCAGSICTLRWASCGCKTCEYAVAK
ncbi:hypothetical protein ACP70R_005658 [Stipagrostis hirtigluma subsp. patula]